MTPNPAYVEAVRNLVHAAPYPAMIGLNIAELDFDRCRIELTLRNDHLQPFGIVHGGVLATLIDTATFWAAFMRLPEDAGLVNVDLKLNYLKATCARKANVCARDGRSATRLRASTTKAASSSRTARRR